MPPSTGSADRARHGSRSASGCSRRTPAARRRSAGRILPPAPFIVVGKLALGLGLVCVRSRPHPFLQAQSHRRTLDRIPPQPVERPAQHAQFRIVVEQQFEFARRVRLDRLGSFELELTC